MPYSINYFNERIHDEVLSLSADLLADYARCIELVAVDGPAPWVPRLRHVRWGLMELRLRGAMDTARVFLCATEVGERPLREGKPTVDAAVIVLHAYQEGQFTAVQADALVDDARHSMRVRSLPRSGYRPQLHDQRAFLGEVASREGFAAAYDSLADEYLLARECVRVRINANLLQSVVAASMGTTAGAVSRLEHANGTSPSLATLRRYSRALGCELELRLIPIAPP